MPPDTNQARERSATDPRIAAAMAVPRIYHALTKTWCDYMSTATFQLEFHPVSEIPDASQDGCDFLLYNQCDGYHIVEAQFDDGGAFDGFYLFAGHRFPESAYSAWAALPDTAEVLFPLFSRKG